MSKISIVIPCWNAEKYIMAFVECLQKQTFHDWNAIFVDDQSTDETVMLLRKVCSNDDRIKVLVRNRNPKGAQTCRNIGTEVARDSEYICYFDADDLFAPYCLEQRVIYMDNHPELDFAVFPAMMICQNGKYKYVYGYPIFEDSLKAMLHITLPMVGWTNIYRISSIKKFDLSWDEKIKSMQDSDFNIQALIKGCKYNYADAEPDYFYRVFNSSSISKQMNSNPQLLSHVYLLSKLVSSLSPEYLIKYERDIKCYFLLFIRRFSGNADVMNIFCRIPWVKTHKWYYIRSWICGYTTPKAIRVLFPYLEMKNKSNVKTWEIEMEKIYKRMEHYIVPYYDKWL